MAQLALGVPAAGVAELREVFAALVDLPQVNDHLVDLVTGLPDLQPEWLDAVGAGATPALCGLALVKVSDLDPPSTRLLIRPDGRVAAVDPDGTEPYRVADALRSWFGPNCR